MVQWAKTLAARPNDPSSILGFVTCKCSSEVSYKKMLHVGLRWLSGKGMCH